MAIINKDTLFDDEHLNGAKWSFGVPLERTNPVPIDKWSTFKTYADAVEFVNRETGNIAYPGQIITIEDPDTKNVDVYVVDRTATDCLKKLASGGSADEIADRVRELSSQLLSADGIIDQLSAAHDALSVALSTEISAETKARTEAIKALEDKLASAWQFRGTVDAAINDDNVAKIEAAFKDPQSGDVVIVNKKFVDEDGTESTAAVEYAFDGETWQQLGDESSSVSKFQLKDAIEKLSATVSAEIDADVEALRTSLSTKIDAKIYAQVGDNAKPVSVDTMTMHKISAEKYAELLKTEGGIVETDLYVISSDYIDGYGEKVKNVADGEEATDAATYGQVINLSTALSNDVKLSVQTLEQKIETAVEGGVKALSSELLTPTTGVIPVLGAKVDTLSTNLSNEIKALSSALSGDVDKLSADVYKDLSVAMTATAGASDDVLSTFTFTQNGKTVGTINLPKDKVIESAKVVFGELSSDGTFTPDDAGSATKSDKSKFYLEVVVANQTEKLYIPVPELADTYVGHKGDRIAITVQSDEDGARCISADIALSSITNDRMANDSITMRNLSGEFIFNCGDAFGYTA